MEEQFRGMSLIDFMDRFPNDEKCKEYLANSKWKDGFTCSKCSHSACWQAINKPFVKVCRSCRHIESVTANTLFHHIRFSLRKAFLIIFEMSTTTKSCSALVMAKKYDINRKTAWLFMHKVRKGMASSCQHPVMNSCEVDEALFGGKVSGKRGRGAAKKKKVSVVIEKAEKGGISRAYAMCIEDFSSKQLRLLFDKHIDKTVKIIDTDKWRGYTPLSKEWNIVQSKSKPGENFNLMHRFIQQIKGWLRGIHHHASQRHMQAYLDEYCYRFNRHRFKHTIFDNIIVKMINTKPVSYQFLISQ